MAVSKRVWKTSWLQLAPIACRSSLSAPSKGRPRPGRSSRVSFKRMRLPTRFEMRRAASPLGLSFALRVARLPQILRAYTDMCFRHEAGQQSSRVHSSMINGCPSHAKSYITKTVVFCKQSSSFQLAAAPAQTSRHQARTSGHAAALGPRVYVRKIRLPNEYELHSLGFGLCLEHHSIGHWFCTHVQTLAAGIRLGSSFRVLSDKH